MKIVYYNPNSGIMNHGQHNPTTTNVGDGYELTLDRGLTAVKVRQWIMLSVQDDRGRTIEIKGN